jgi:hypothetical protein
MPIIAVGNSAFDVLGDWADNRKVISQGLKLLEDSRDRGSRILEASEIDSVATGRYFVDDVAVTGNTLKTALEAAKATPRDEVVVGLAFNSRRLRARVGASLQSAIVYEQIGGGVPAMNSLSTLVDNPRLVADYSERKKVDPKLLDAVIAIYKEVL